MRSLAHPDEHAALVLEPNHFSAAGLRHGLGTELPVASLLGSVPLDGTRHRPCDSRLRSASELNGIRVLDARVSGQASQPSTSLPMGGDATRIPQGARSELIARHVLQPVDEHGEGLRQRACRRTRSLELPGCLRPGSLLHQRQTTEGAAAEVGETLHAPGRLPTQQLALGVRKG